KLEEKWKKTGELTEEEQKRYNELAETVEKQREARDFLIDELNVYRDLNSLAEAKMEKIDEETKKRINNLAAVTGIKIEEGNIVKQIQNKNSEIDKSISKLEKERDKQGANKEEINKQIKELQQKKALNDGVLEQILKELGVWDQVKDTIESGTSKEKDKGKAVDETKRKLDAQGKQTDSNNRKTELGIKKEEKRAKEACRNVSKTVTATDKGTVSSIEKRASAPKTKTINIKEKG